MSAPEPEKLLHYDIIEILGSGGNGTVYRARDADSGRVVALKTLKKAGEATLSRFKREFLGLKKMKNPGIVEVYDGYFDHQPPFFSMEWVRGKTLSQVLRDMEQNPLVFDVADRENFAIRLAIQVCDILAYIHGFEEVHRDLKPDNLFITLASQDILSEFTVKMLDFGLLKQLGEQERRDEDSDSQSGMIVGTVHYLSPEQAKGSEVDPRSDLFSLGVIMYKIVSLKLPYDATDVVSYIFKTVFEEPTPIDQQTPECSKRLQATLKDLLAKDPGKRPPSAKSLKRRLQSLLEPDPAPLADIQAADLDLLCGIEGFGSPLLPPPRIGREDAVKALERQLDLLETQHPLAAVLTGETGMGRTSVVKEWKLRVQFKKPIFLQAHFAEEAVPSQDPIGLLLDSLIRTLKPEEVRLLFREVYPFLAHASRYLSRYFDVKSVGRFDHLSPGRKLQVLAVNFIKLLQKLTERGPVVIVLDDVHNAPERFLGWLTLVWEQLGRTKALLVYSLSPDADNQAASRFADRLLELPNALSLTLEALSPEQVLELLQAMLPIGVELPFSEKLKKLIIERANGNPFHTVELFSRLYEDEQVYLNKGALDIKNVDKVDAPRSIQQALLKKATRLPAESLLLLKIAATFGASVELATLRAYLKWPEDKLLEQVRILLKAGVLSEETEPVHKLAFSAPTMQKMLYGQIAVKERRQFHERAARALERLLDNEDTLALEQIAYHFANAANHVRAVKYAYLAGNCALEAKETDKAVRFFEMSLSMMDRMKNKQARNLVNLKLAEVHLANGQPEEALEYYSQSLAMENLSKLEELRSLRGRMRCYLETDQLSEAYSDAKALCRIGAQSSDRIHAETLMARGRLAWLATGDAAAFRQDAADAVQRYAKPVEWRLSLTYAQILTNEGLQARKQLTTLAKDKRAPQWTVHLQLAALAYFTGDFDHARGLLERVRAEHAQRLDEQDPKLMIAQALLAYKILSTMAPDHSSTEYLAIAQRYIERFELTRMHVKITLTRLEHSLINGRPREAWALVQQLANQSFDLPAEHMDRRLFLCLAVRAAWELEERPPRGWLIQYQKIQLEDNAPFLLLTHWALAKGAEALLPYSTAAPQALECLKKAETLLVKLKFKYYYRAVLAKQIAMMRKLEQHEAADKLERLRRQIDASLRVALPQA